ncbi:FliM/FliN family flagellar motor switch protein [Pseudooceanicola sediminis]|uniref:FliM/FliN family flagellar motor switch protein n=1 Tax=Pseudooceanicola sediminis TaxID=2211117 RepID=A0A399IZS9_9RHOB|nr:FliM/FliN family flagellar motor switch protein [Pseudooceanicola sediminis]|tara:strand:+ start:101554 stop:102792 length:1239 start_codon:yes stop_codon:yes gene_type:complete
MVNGNSNAVLRRKAVAAREVYQARAMSPEKALRLALSKSADDLLDLPLVVMSTEYEFIAAEALSAMLSDEELLMLLDGHGGTAGAVSLDLQATSALVEQSTMGRVSPLAADPRATTATDAALVAPLLDDVLLRAAMMLEGDPAADWLTGYCFGVRIENKRLLGLALRATDFHVFRIQIDLAGLKQGRILLALPDREAIPDEAALQEGADRDRSNISAAVMSAPAVIDAVLHRLSMPLAQVTRLKPGDMIPISREALSSTRLETGRGQCLGKVRLGQVNGFRAVRLTMDGLAEARSAIEAGEGDGLGTSAFGGGRGLGADADDADELPMLGGLPGADDLPDPGDFSADAAVGETETDDLPALGDFPAMGDLPDLPDLSDLPELSGGDDTDEEDGGFAGGFPMMSMGDLPDLEP